MIARPRYPSQHLQIPLIVDQYVLRADIPNGHTPLTEHFFNLHECVEKIQHLLLVEGPADVGAVDDLVVQGVKELVVSELHQERSTSATPPVPQ